MTTLKLLVLPFLLVLALSACGSSGDASVSTTQRLVETTRSLATGTVETETIEYTNSGNLLREVFRRDGEIYWTSTYETNDDGRLIRRSDDTNQDDLEDLSSTYSYVDGQGLRRIDRVDSNMLIYQVDIFQFEGARAISRETRNTDDVVSSDLVDESSGTLVAQRNFVYENDRISRNNIDTDGDGAIDRQEVYRYNPDGTLATTTLSSVTEGAISSAMYVYEQGSCTVNGGNSVTNFFCVTTE